MRLRSSYQSQANWVIWVKLLLQENAKDGKFCNDEVVGFDSAFEGVFQNLISLALSNWNKEKQFLH